MGLKSALETEVQSIFRSRWTERDGEVVPDDEDVGLGNDAVKLTATVLYADLADSTKMVTSNQHFYSAEVYKAFLRCAAKIIRAYDGAITAYDGDRIMAVYIGGSKNTNAVKSAMKIRYAVENIIDPLKDAQYPDSKPESVRFVVGIDTSDLFVAKTGIRGSNDLVWVGRAANYAAKLAALPSTYTYVTSEVYQNMNESVIVTEGRSMWETIPWYDFDGRTIYRSNWWWSFE
jgi:class 3 adenylate cyclase